MLNERATLVDGEDRDRLAVQASGDDVDQQRGAHGNVVRGVAIEQDGDRSAEFISR